MTTAPGAGWEPFRVAGRSLVDGVADHVAALQSRPVWQPLPDEVRSQICDLPLPDEPEALDDLVGTMGRAFLGLGFTRPCGV